MSRFIAVFTETDRITPQELDIACKAIQKQIERHVEPEWGERTYVAYSPTSSPAPGWERVGIYDELDFPNVNGFHAVQNGQPFALVRYSPFWTLDLSHEVLEMVCDPTGRSFRSGQSLDPAQGSVSYLLEICDACQDFDDSYFVEGVRVCNFFKRNYFTPGAVPGASYSMPNAMGDPVLQGPLTISPNGYLTWFHEPGNQWYCADRFDGDVRINPVDPPTMHFSTLRGAVDTIMEERIQARRKALQSTRKLCADDFFDKGVQAARIARGARLRDYLKRISDEACVWHEKKMAACKRTTLPVEEAHPEPAIPPVEAGAKVTLKPKPVKKDQDQDQGKSKRKGGAKDTQKTKINKTKK